MSLNCCLFKLKKDQLSSYYISNINDEHNQIEKENLTNSRNDPNLNVNNQIEQSIEILNKENTQNEGDKNEVENKEKNNYELEKNKQQFQQQNLEPIENEQISKNIAVINDKKMLKNNSKNNSKFDTIEIENEKLDLIDNLPSDIGTNNNKFKLIRQLSLNSETQSNQLSTNSNQNMNNSNAIPNYYELKIKLKDGKNLAIRDLCGSSDPYAKFTLNGVNVYKSKIIFKNLNPEWNEDFVVKLNPFDVGLSSVLNRLNQTQNDTNSLQSSAISYVDTGISGEQLSFFLSKFKLKIFVYDYDRGFLNDDLIGYASIDFSDFKENIQNSIEVELEDEKLNKYEYLGLISLDITLIPKYTAQDKETSLSNPVSTTAKLTSVSSVQTMNRSKKAPYQLWQSVLNIVLLEANDLLTMDDNGYSDPYVKLRLENERYRSKIVRRNLNPKFLEQFQFYIYDTSKMTLHISVHHSTATSDEIMGKTSFDLKTLDIEKTNFVKLPLEDDAGFVTLLLTITGIYGNDFVTDLDSAGDAVNEYRDNIIRNYGLLNSFNDINDIGWLQVKVIRAENLASADINGKSDPFCCLQLINQYVQTHTEYKTLNPEWGKIFEFKVTDLHAILEVTVFDEDRNKAFEFLGKIEIPIISIQNGKRKIYALKDRKLLHRAKGAIELEMNLIYNPIKAVIKTFNPREDKLIPPETKLKIPELKQNIMRVHNIAQGFINTAIFIDSCFRWEDTKRSSIAFLSFILIVLNFELYMLPLTVLMIFFKNYAIIKLKSAYATNQDEDDNYFDYIDEEEKMMDIESKEPKKSFSERLNEVQEICLKVQETLEYVASLGERVINTFLFTTPWLSWLACIVMIIASIILYIVPLRYLILLWGINKFTKKFRKPPDYVDNIELLDFLSRVPSKKEVFQYKEFRIEKTMTSNGAVQSSSVNNKNVKKKKA